MTHLTAAGPVRLVYILAASHSGSTLLAFLLGSHPELCTVGELKATRLGPTDSYRCSCDRLIVECPFWRGVSAEMAARGFDFRITEAGTDIRSGAPAYLRRVLRPLTRPPAVEAIRDAVLALSPGWRAHLRRVQDVNAALARSVLARTGARGLVDSSKIGFRLKYLLQNPAFDVRVVRLIRDGRAAALTYVDPERFADSRRPDRRGGGSGASREQERLSLAAGAREWRRSNEEAVAVLARVPRDRWTQIRYEDLARDPRGTLAPVFRFLGVSGEAPLDAFKAREHHVVGNGMRFDTSSEIVLDERWRTTLTADDLRTFEREAGALNRALGYA